jgi:hypothetical protein
MAGADFTNGDFLLYINSGVNASATPYIISSFISGNSLSLTASLSDDPSIQYSIVHINKAGNHEKWINGTVTSANSITLSSSLAFTRNNTPLEWAFVIQPNTNTAANFDLDMQLGSMQSPTVMALNSNVLGSFINSPIRIMPRLTDRSMARTITGSVVKTYNYYNSDFFNLPVVKIQSVQLLDPQTLTPAKDLPYALNVNNPSLRYSVHETNSIKITDLTAIHHPIRVSYLSDLAIAQVDKYLTNDDIRVLNCNQMAKRMETISVIISCKVRTDSTAALITERISTFVNTTKSTDTLSKDRLIQYLYKNNYISYIDVPSLRFDGVYYQLDGTVTPYTNVGSFFGSETACYLAQQIIVSLL